MSIGWARQEHDIVDVCSEACGRCGIALYPRQRCVGILRLAENVHRAVVAGHVGNMEQEEKTVVSIPVQSGKQADLDSKATPL